MILNLGSVSNGVVQMGYTGAYAGGGTVYPYTAPYGLVDTNSLFSGQVYEDGSEFRIVTGPSNGTLDAAGAESGTLWGNDVDDIYTPTAGYTGDDSVTLEVKYVDGTTAQWVATIAVEAAATQVPQGTWTIGTITTGETTASLTPSYSLSDAASYQYSINSGTWTTFTGTISLTGLADETAFSGALRATNSVGSGASASFSFTTDRIPVPPTVSTALPDLDLSEGETVSINLGNYFAGAVSYGVTGLPAGLTLSGSVISGTAQAGTSTVTVTATNDDGSVSDAFITEVADTTAPVISVNSLTTLDTSPSVNGRSGDAATLSLVVNSVTYNPSPSDGTWSQQLPTLPLGTYLVTLNGADAAGNAATESKTELRVVDVLPVAPASARRIGTRLTVTPAIRQSVSTAIQQG